jgi:hypothetical protein
MIAERMLFLIRGTHLPTQVIPLGATSQWSELVERITFGL